MRTTTILASLFVLAACATTVTQMTTSETDRPMAEEALIPNGTATISGSALIRQRGGGVVTCAGNYVHLFPALSSTSSHVRAAFGGDTGYVSRGGNVGFGGGTRVAPPQPNRAVMCDAQGFFEFSDVSAGKWYVMTSVVWDVGGDYQGGTLLGSATVEAGDEVELTLSH